MAITLSPDTTKQLHASISVSRWNTCGVPGVAEAPSITCP
jgi:hypothetical protein